MAKSFWTKLTQWQNYAHYVLLTLIIDAVGVFFGMPFSFKTLGILFIALLVGDTLVHGLFYVLPKPLRWRD